MPALVVVGGGILGTMHAVMARRHGWTVTQLERDPEPRNASVRNFGLVWVSGRADGAELDLALRARELWEAVGADVPGAGFRANGSLTLALRDDELAVLRQVADAADADRRGFALLDPSGVRAHNPAVRGDLTGALLCTKDAVVEPRHVLPALRAHLAGDGYTFLARRTVLDVEPGRVRDHTGAVHEADAVVLCTGDVYDLLAADHFAHAPLRRCRLQMLQTAPFGDELTTSIADGDSLRYYPAFAGAAQPLTPPPPIVEEWGMQLLLVQRADGGLTIGDTHAYDEPFDFALESAPYEHLIERAEAILGRPLPPVRRRWAGVYSQSTDDAVVHRATLDDGVHLVTGPGGRGMTLSPAVAEHTITQVLA